MTQRRSDERGAAAVEFALVLLPLMLIVGAIITFGWLFAQKQAIGNAARQTARYGVVEARTCHNVTDPVTHATSVGVIEQAEEAASPLVSLTSNDVTVKRGTEWVETQADGKVIRHENKITVCTGAADEQPCKGSAAGDNIYVTIDYKARVLIPVVPGMGSSMDLDGEGVFRCEFF